MGTFFVIKRDGSRIGFEIQRIINAIKKAAQAVGIQDERFCHDIAQKVSNDIFARHQQEIDISHIQKIVEDHLWRADIRKLPALILNIVTSVIWRVRNVAN